ncbi:MAG TPA: DUF4124 domain-containing protein, partial [Ramlibacter sp.]|nr:DUF4124 domain-containing protein [Ramlibacter sp.]
MTRVLPRLALAAAALVGALPAWGQGIYTCIDGKGRRLTSDRPIPECIDREQKELGPTGTVRRTLKPVLTPTEQAAQEERERKANEERQRAADERRVLKALLTRYPNQSSHDAERVKSMQTVQDAIASGQRRIGELQAQRKQLNTETEFYKSPAQWPAKLKRQVEEIEQQVAAQQRFIAAQEEEKRRMGARFDEELAKLRTLW